MRGWKQGWSAGLVMLACASAWASASGATLRYAEDRAPASANPLFTTTLGEARLTELVFEGLFSDGYDLRSTPRLASAITVAPDGMSATVTLRESVRWQDGAPFTAADVVFTVDAMRRKENASPEAGRMAFIDTVTAQGDTTVRFTFTRPEIAPQDKLQFKILPAHKFKGAIISRDDPFRTQPIGTGPFRLDRFQADGGISLVAWTGYHGSCRLDEVVTREVSDKAYQSKLLLYQSLEAVVRVLSRDIATLQSDRSVELYPYQTNSWWYLGMNQRGRWSDPRLREAITSMVDVDALLGPIGTGDRVSGPFVPSSPYYDHKVPLAEPSPERASSLLREAGYTFDGRTWSLGGAPLEVRIAAPKDMETALDVVVNLQSQLQAGGLTVQTTFLDAATWRETVWSKRDFDVVLSMWSFDRNEDIREQFYSTGSRNFVGYANPEVDRLLDLARTTTDPQQKKASLRHVHALVAADRPVVFLWTLDSYAAMSSRVKNVVVHPFYFFTWARDWYLTG
jgi:peptide/nickel transport system substrate-binding protein